MIPSSGTTCCNHDWAYSSNSTAGTVLDCWYCGRCGQEVGRWGQEGGQYGHIIDRIEVETPPKKKRERTYPQPGRRSTHR